MQLSLYDCLGKNVRRMIERLVSSSANVRVADVVRVVVNEGLSVNLTTMNISTALEILECGRNDANQSNEASANGSSIGSGFSMLTSLLSPPSLPSRAFIDLIDNRRNITRTTKRSGSKERVGDVNSEKR